MPHPLLALSMCSTRQPQSTQYIADGIGLVRNSFLLQSCCSHSDPVRESVVVIVVVVVVVVDLVLTTMNQGYLYPILTTLSQNIIPYKKNLISEVCLMTTPPGKRPPYNLLVIYFLNYRLQITHFTN